MSFTPLVLAFTHSYIVPALVCVRSVLESAGPKDKFRVICLVNGEVSDREQNIMKSLSEDRLVFSFINMETFSLDIDVDERFTIATYYRLLLPDILLEYDKVIYLDCDIVVRQNMAELYRNTIITPYYLAGVYEATLDFQEEYILSIGCELGKYFNAGFLVMNLAKMREENMVPLFLKYANNSALRFNDQDVLNQLCKDKFLPLSPVYNGIRTFFIEKYKDSFLRYYSEKEWDKVQQSATVHYTGAKPWNSFTVKFEVWWNHYLSLPLPIRKMMEIKPRLVLLGRFYQTGIGKGIMDGLVRLQRQLKRN